MATDLSERVFKETQRAVDKFNKHSERELRKIKNLYIGARKRISGEIAENWPDVVKQGTTPFGLERLRGLQLGIDTELGRLNQDFNTAIPQMVGDAGDMGIRSGQVELAQLLHDFPDLHPTFGIINTQAIDVYSGYALQLSQQYSAELTRQIQSALQMGLIDQKTTGQLVTQIRQYMGAEYKKVAKAITAKARRIVRTEMSRSFSAGHEAYGRSTDFIIGEKWHVNPMAIWPCPQCESLEGSEYYYDKGEARPSIPLHPNCYSLDTEVLTKEGFKYFSALTPLNQIATLNPGNLNIEYYHPLAIVNYKYNGQMYHYASSKVDLMVTPDHYLWATYQSNNKYPPFHLRQAKEERSTLKFFRSSDWIGTDKPYFKINELKFRMEDWMKFFGIWLAEGSLGRRGNRKGVIVHQSNQENKILIKKMLQFLPYKVHEYKDRFFFTSAPISDYLVQFGKAKEKFIPNEIKELSPKYLKIFLEWFCLGDGWISKVSYIKGYPRKPRRAFSTSSIRLADDIQELLLKIGSCGNQYTPRNGNTTIAEHNCSNYVRAKKMPWNNTSQILKEDYNDDVWCCEVPAHHTLYVRRNGKPVWSGNCRCFSTYLYRKELFTKEEMGKLRGLVHR